MTFLITCLFATSGVAFASLTAFLCLRNKVAAATVAGAMALLSILLAYFPSLSSLDALSVHVKMRENLGESERILARIKTLAIKGASSAIFSLGNTNPYDPQYNTIGLPVTEDQRNLINGMLLQVKGLDLGESDKSDTLSPLIDHIDLQLMLVYGAAIEGAADNFNDLKDKADKEHRINSIQQSVIATGLNLREDAMMSAMKQMDAFASLTQDSLVKSNRIKTNFIRYHRDLLFEYTFDREIADVFRQLYKGEPAKSLIDRLGK